MVEDCIEIRDQPYAPICKAIWADEPVFHIFHIFRTFLDWAYRVDGVVA